MKNTDIQSENSVDETDKKSMKESCENSIEEDNEIQVYRREGAHEKKDESSIEEDDEIQVYHHEVAHGRSGGQNDQAKANNTGGRDKTGYGIKRSVFLRIVLVIGVALIILLAVMSSGEEVEAVETESEIDILDSENDSEAILEMVERDELSEQVYGMYYGYMKIEAVENASNNEKQGWNELNFAAILEVSEMEDGAYGFSLYSPELDTSFDFEAFYDENMFKGDSVNEALRFEKYYNFEAYIDDCLEPEAFNGFFVLPVIEENIIISYTFSVSKEGIDVPENIGAENASLYNNLDYSESDMSFNEDYVYDDYEGVWRIQFNEESLNSNIEYLIIDAGNVSLGELGSLAIEQEGSLIYFVDGIAFQAEYVRYWDSIEVNFQAYNDVDGVYMIQNNKVYYGAFDENYEAVLYFEEVLSYPDYIFTDLHEVSVVLNFMDDSICSGSFMMQSEEDGMFLHTFKAVEQEDNLALTME